MIKIRFLTIAEMEVDEAVSWYQEQSEDESLAFLNEIDHAIRIVRAYPLIATEIEPDIHSFCLHRFPYSLIYGVDNDELVVIAIAHHRRAPHYWADRVQ
jgi:plasmid stabilization system protein ParE